MLTRPRLAVLTIALTMALIAAACGGDDDNDDQPAASADTEVADEAPATPTPEAPDSLPDPTIVPDDDIDVSGLGPVVDGEADDDFDRCSVYTAETLSGLLGELWAFEEGTPKETIACTWTSGEGEELGFVLVAMGAVGDEFDPRFGDSAATAVESEVAIGDVSYDIIGSTYGPGVAFQQGDVGALVHVVWGTPNTVSRVAVEREAELRVAANLAARLPAGG